MSLINDALRRKNPGQPPAAQTAAPEATPTERPLQPVPPRKSAAPVGLIVLAICIIGIGGWFLTKWARAQRETSALSPATVVAPGVAQKSGTVSVPVADRATPAAPQPVETVTTPSAEPVSLAPSTVVIASQQNEAAEAAPVAVAPVVSASDPVPTPKAEPVNSAMALPAVAAPFPTLKLQGIFFNPSRPSAVINGKTYSVGASVAGVRLIKIEPESVTVEWQGEQRVLETAQ